MPANSSRCSIDCATVCIVEAFVAMAAGKSIDKPLKGAGQPNAACETTPRKTWGPDARGIVDNHDTNENGMSINLLFTYAKFRIYDPADSTRNKDREVMCPVNNVGTVDFLANILEIPRIHVIS